MQELSPDIEARLLVRLRSGDETAFATLVENLHGRLLAFAGTFTRSPGLAEDIVQETWLGVIRGLHAFEGRSSLRTWIYNILVRRARTLAAREARQARPPAGGGVGPTVEWEPGRGRVGLWDEPPVPWSLEDPEAFFEMRETAEVVERALDALPEAQRRVVLLRDVEGISAADACNILGVSETNQRVLLHRGRARIRQALDEYIRGVPRAPFAPEARHGRRDRLVGAPARSASARRSM